MKPEAVVSGSNAQVLWCIQDARSDILHLWARIDQLKWQLSQKETHWAMLERAAQHFVFLERLALSKGPIRHEGKIVPKWQTIAVECQAAFKKITELLKVAA